MGAPCHRSLRGGGLLRRVRDRFYAAGRRAQRGAVLAGLFLLYAFGFGAVKLYLSVIKPSVLHFSKLGDGSYWLPSNNEPFDESRSLRQS